MHGPQIWFNGANITGTTQTVFVGQPIELTTMPAPQAGQSQSWSGIPLNAITGGFTVTPSPTCPITSPFGTPGEPPPAQPGRLLQCTGTVTTLSGSNFLSASTPQFYWILPGTYLVAYHVTLSDGTAQAAYATFVVEGPTNPSFTFQGTPVIVGATKSPANKLSDSVISTIIYPE
jgi:hypothetical protein